jgi:DNA-binding HxlR family transcriptional regulator
MVIKRGFIEILQLANGNDPKSFNDFTRISVGKSRLSSATVAKRLDRLIAVKAIEEVITRSKVGRRIIAYRATEKGKRAIELANELQELFAAPKAK